MYHRVHATLAFTTPDEATDFYHDCQLAIQKAITINPGQPTEEKGTITLEECYHDEDPPRNCTLICHEETP